jgi:hypothetical protein
VRDIPPRDIPQKPKGGKIMKMKSKTKMIPGLLVLLISAWALVLFATPAKADDLDADGSDCLLEKYGYCANIQQPGESAAGIYLPAANDLGAFFPKGNCCANCGELTDAVNKDDPDLFVILGTVSTGSKLLSGQNWLQMINRSVPGLTKPLHVHRVNRDPFTNYNRVIVNKINVSSPDTPTPAQNAVRIYEKLNSGTDPLGQTPQQGTPNTENDIALYTARIENFVNQTCSGKTCVFTDYSTTPPTQRTLTPGSDLTLLKGALTRQVIAHETGHTTMLTPTLNTKLNAYHYASSTTGTIMEASVYFTSKGTTVTWYFPAGYAAADVPKLQ